MRVKVSDIELEEYLSRSKVVGSIVEAMLKKEGTAECILHGLTRSTSPEGYGLVVHPHKKSCSTRLHKVIHWLFNGVPFEQQVGECIRHTCDNPLCINPSHLMLGSWAENNRDRAERDRSAKRVPSRQALTKGQCHNIVQRYTANAEVRGTLSGLARLYGVDRKVIYRVIKGEYHADND